MHVSLPYHLDTQHSNKKCDIQQESLNAEFFLCRMSFELVFAIKSTILHAFMLNDIMLSVVVLPVVLNVFLLSVI